MGSFDNIRKTAKGQGDDWEMIWLDYKYFNKHYKMIEKQILDAHPKAIQQINITENLDWPVGPTMFSLLKKQKKPFEIFHEELWKCSEFILL